MQARAILTEREGRRIIYIGYLDATDRIEAQKKQYLQQQALEQAIDHSNLMFWEYDCSSHTAYSGQKVQSLFGLGKIVDNFPETWLRMGYILRRIRRPTGRLLRILTMAPSRRNSAPGQRFPAQTDGYG